MSIFIVFFNGEATCFSSIQANQGPATAMLTTFNLTWKKKKITRYLPLAGISIIQEGKNVAGEAMHSKETAYAFISGSLVMSCLLYSWSFPYFIFTPGQSSMGIRVLLRCSGIGI